jgi:hypothetical protein
VWAILQDSATPYSAFVKHLVAPPQCVTADEPAAEIMRATATHLRLAVKRQDEVFLSFTIALWFNEPFDSESWPIEFAKTDAGWRVRLTSASGSYQAWATPSWPCG